MVADAAIGKTVSLEVLRKGRKENLQITLAKLDDGAQTESPARASSPSVPKLVSKLSQLGFALAPIDRATRAKFKLGGAVEGVVITDVDPDSPAGEKDIRPGDVIVEVQNDVVRTPDDVSKHLETDARSGRKAVLLLVNRDGQLNYVALRLGEAG
jgi:serine protease Do